MNRILLVAIDVVADLHADEAPRNTGPDFGKASPFGLLVIVLLLIGTFLLVRSMNRQLKKVPESFDRPSPEPDQAPADDGAIGDHPPDERDESTHEPDS
ncbi:hypothetical protein [Mycobacterium sp.]|uniref:hypothetical protein n=1 Tax=Mycobacterium sp. TaxID=1785 RepID=UPI0031CE04CC